MTLKAWLSEVVALLAILAVIGLQQRQARADFIATTGGHGPLSASGTFWDRGAVQLWSSSQGEMWIGDMGAYYIAHPSAGLSYPYVARSPSYTFAIAYEFENAPGSFSGRNQVLTSTFVQLAWTPAAIVIEYDPPCPTTNATAWTSLHTCTLNYTPMDGGGRPTVSITDAFGHSLNLPGNTNHVECEAHLPNYPNVPHPGGLPDDVVAVYSGACP